MTVYIIAGLAAVASYLYGLYERTKRVQAEAALAESKKQVVQAQADEAAQRVRYEALVADLKKQLSALEATFDAHATPDAVRARFRELFPRPAGPADAPAPGVPAGPAAGAGAGGGLPLPR